MYNVYPFTGFKLDWTSTAKPIPKCGCNEIGTEEENCKSKTEKCKCKPNYTGEKCDQCSGDYWMSSNGKFMYLIPRSTLKTLVIFYWIFFIRYYSQTW